MVSCSYFSYSCCYEHSEIVKRLVKAPGIDLNFQEPNCQESAAMIAVRRRRYWSVPDYLWKDWEEEENVKILS